MGTDTAVAERMAFMNQLFRLFSVIDADNDGKLTKPEFYSLLEDERYACFLGALGIDKMSVDKFFETMDVDLSGTLDLAEFVDICSSLKGSAKIMHIRMLEDEVQSLHRSLKEILFEMKGHASPFTSERECNL